MADTASTPIAGELLWALAMRQRTTGGTSRNPTPVFEQMVQQCFPLSPLFVSRCNHGSSSPWESEMYSFGSSTLRGLQFWDEINTKAKGHPVQGLPHRTALLQSNLVTMTLDNQKTGHTYATLHRDTSPILTHCVSKAAPRRFVQVRTCAPSASTPRINKPSASSAPRTKMLS
jgi:hypothetical protein